MIKLLIIGLFVLNFQQHKKIDLVGFWHASTSIGSGYDDSYLFYDDGKVEFYYNTMQCDNEIIAYKGVYRYNNPSTVMIVYTEVTKIVGATKKPVTDGSCASTYYLEGGEIISTRLKKPIKKIITISNFAIDNNYFDLPRLHFNEQTFWKISENPNLYYEK